MGLQFPTNINTSDSKYSDVFLMYPTAFKIERTLSGVNRRKEIDMNQAISLPTPGEGITLNESGNWDETAGYQDFKGSVLGAGGKALMEGAGSLGKVTLGKGLFVNDYASLSYTGSNFRTYTFSWDLIPSSEVEAKEIVKIIKVIRENALPSYGNGSTVLKYPAMWKVYPAIKTEINLFLKDCVITNFTVNYTPDGVLRRYRSGHPVSVNMSIEFKELYRADKGDV